MIFAKSSASRLLCRSPQILLVRRNFNMAGRKELPSHPAVQLKTPKGTRDWFGSDVILRDSIFKNLSDIFRRYGGKPLDTPVFELKDILTGKYGEDAKLIYDLKDQGGELSSLRFDLTVPFARWLAMNKDKEQVKRYHIAKVYRRDQPAIARGRLREFHQCDFDIAGEYAPMIPDSQIICIIVDAFEALGLDITIKMNHRRILDGLFVVAGVPKEKTRTISAAVDKLDKMAWAEVKKEMVEEKGLPEEVADRIGEYVKNKGGLGEMVTFLKDDAKLMEDADVQAGVSDLDLALKYLKAMDAVDKVSFDLSLARGLDYYTGVIFEVVYKPGESPPEKKSKSKKADDAAHVGSIAAGGRYDNLVGMYGKKTIPCVGISFGVDRIFTILKSRKETEEGARERDADVYVMAFGGKEFNGLLEERVSIFRTLMKANISTKFMEKVKPKLPQQFKAAEADGVPLAVILGQDEVAAGQVRLKVLGLPENHPEKEGVLIAREKLVEEVKKQLDKLKLA